MNERGFEKQPAFELPKEMGFQSYELLAGDGEVRNAQKKLFLDGEVRNPTLDYPKLNEPEILAMIRNLEPVLNNASEYDDETLGEVVWNSASYRMAEMYWLLEAKRLNEFAANPESEEFQQSARRFQEVNEQLYSSPDEETKEKVYGEILAQVKEKNLHPTAQVIYDQLVNGVTVYLENEQVRMSGIGDNHQMRLPGGVKEKLTNLREVLEEEFSDAIRIIDDYWNTEIMLRDEENPGFSVDDMKAVFERVRDFYDPTNIADISIVIDPNSTGLAWDTPSMSVKIGGKRGAIHQVTEMYAAVIHEYGVHGLRAVNGKKTRIPAFGTGMYSDASEGERSDYLTFEEGFATLCGMSIDDDFSKWSSAFLNYYFAIASRYEGNDFRQTHERLWRMMTLMNVGDNEEVTDKLIDRARKNAYTGCVRVFRGTPTQVANGPTLTFNKDLAYLNGKLDALRYLDECSGDRESITRLFLGKFDPNNRIQNSLVEKYVEEK